MGKVYFLFGVHNHQPVGNFPHVFKDAYKRCYFPFISLLDKFPQIKFSLHNSGCLYDWILENRKEYIEILQRLVKRGQVELISGGYYEPILPLIPDEDKKGQLRLMNDFIKRKFRCKPHGMWVAERVWEPYLARIIHSCDLKYTFLDDTHFRFAGLQQKEFSGYYTTEEEAKPIYVFPISKTLRYKIPFSQPQEALGILQGFAQNQDILITLFDDGEKFGLWPDTYEWVYSKKWLEQFLSLLKKSPCIETITPQEAIKKFSPKGIVYLPTAAYEEMGEWVLEPQSRSTYESLVHFLKTHNKLEEFKDFVRGGFFRNFYRKYSRLNYLHKRMLSLSKKIHTAATFKRDRDIFIDLWKAQTNCGYWHGIFGGFYLGHIRQAIYAHLIRAESALSKRRSKGNVVLEAEDIDLDGQKEIMLKNKNIVCCFSPKGGTLLELSLRNPAMNLLNTITRRQESYHGKIKQQLNPQDEATSIHNTISQKEEGLEKFIVYDRYERLGLVDHLLEKGIAPNDFHSQRGISTLSDRIYQCAITKTKRGYSLNWRCRNKDLDFSKKVHFSTFSGFDVLYAFKRKKLLNIYDFGIEFNLSLPSLKDIVGEAKNKTVSLCEPRSWSKIRSLTIIDRYSSIGLEFECMKADVWSAPLYSVSSSESGVERVYQQITLLFAPKNIKDNFKLSLQVQEL
ncbi:MAG: DUF1926 domain-containing protein [Candidatus Omnitrophota bacterium]|nr:MAG: DUF1926 domain-containing protein [Candidatus Omnitrophota bacterium]